MNSLSPSLPVYVKYKFAFALFFIVSHWIWKYNMKKKKKSILNLGVKNTRPIVTLFLLLLLLIVCFLVAVSQTNTQTRFLNSPKFRLVALFRFLFKGYWFNTHTIFNEVKASRRFFFVKTLLIIQFHLNRFIWTCNFSLRFDVLLVKHFCFSSYTFCVHRCVFWTFCLSFSHQIKISLSLSLLLSLYVFVRDRDEKIRC